MIHEELIIWDPVSQDYVALFMGEAPRVQEKASETMPKHRKELSLHRNATFSLFPNTDTTKLSKSKSLSQKASPDIPQRVSSMSTRRRKNRPETRPDLATFHRQSCELFASLDGKLSPPPKYEELVTTSSNALRNSHIATSSSQTSSSRTRYPVSTHRAASCDNLKQYQSVPIQDSKRKHRSAVYPSTTNDIMQGRQRDSGQFEGVTVTESGTGAEKLNKSRSYSQLSPKITSTEQMIWTSTESRQAEYAKIDKANSGLRGLMKKVVPGRWRNGGSRRAFYGEKIATMKVQHSNPKDQAVQDWIDATAAVQSRRRRRDSDESSVRRFRMSVDKVVHAEPMKANILQHIIQVDMDPSTVEYSPDRAVLNEANMDLMEAEDATAGNKTKGLRRRLSRTFSTYFR